MFLLNLVAIDKNILLDLKLAMIRTEYTLYKQAEDQKVNSSQTQRDYILLAP